uniref:Uncharacterized protein n=1 Tax=viral metagenome TaxID=1070528 RepID=A0A6H1ZYP4_9ZZZZ
MKQQVNNKMTAFDITLLLRDKYKDKPDIKGKWAYFEELRNQTGFNSRRSYCDAVAVGLWNQNAGIIAYEIKISRSDFLSDVAQFQHKHKFILDIANEFYYICPPNLVQPNEVPDRTGLRWAQSGRIVTKKQAPVQKVESIPFGIFRSFCRNAGSEINSSLIPVKYLNSEMTQKDMLAIIEAEVKKQKDWCFDMNVNEKVKTLTEAVGAEKAKIDNFVAEVKGIAGIGWHVDNPFSVILDFLRQNYQEKTVRNQAKVLKRELDIFLSEKEGT